MIFKINFQIGSNILPADILMPKRARVPSISLRLLPIFLAGFLMVLVNTGKVLGQNPIVQENLLPGNPKSEWDISGAGDLSIQGFATDMSVNKGSTVRFKINVNGAATFRIRIYRLGYYNGSGARLITDLGNFTGRVQPSPLSNSSTGLVDCGNWLESASWAVPATAVSGLYLAKLTRSDNNGSSHIAFVVRDDNANSNLLFKTSDATWQAYNVYGGNSLYVGSTSYPGGHAVKVSYNRPFITRNGGGGGGPMEDWLFNAEYPMIRWLERNGYDVSYTTDVDMSRDATPITPLKHKVLLSVGHDEYWSLSARTRFENARAQGVHLAFFSGNEVYWKTRWENSIDGTNTPYRTLVCYKEGTLGENVCGTKCDPVANTWTGLWRDGCNYPSADGCRPENALTGQISWVDATGSITVPSTYRTLPFWRHTSIAALANGQSVTFPNGTLGYEWDGRESAYSSSYPSGRQVLSSTSLAGKIHELSLYTHSSGAKVFGAGTVQWSWGLDNVHDRGNAAPSRDMQQATVNLFWDMGVIAGSLQGDLFDESGSTDTQAPTSSISSPVNGATLTAGNPVSISGTATDLGGGTVAAVDITTDGGVSWQRATGTTNWTYSWTPVFNGTFIIKSRGIDNRGNTEIAGTAPATNAITVNVTGSSQDGPYTIWSPTTVPAILADPDASAIELGVKFRASVNGFITGLRFYKSSTNTGTHTANLWSLTGTNLARATFTSETASGWQQVLFSTPVAIVAGTTYVASYHTPTGNYSVNENYFTATTGITPYVQALGDGVDGPNGVYNYSSNTIFPSSSFSASNYWVDVVFTPNAAPDTSPPTVTATSPVNLATGVNVTSAVTATFSEDISSATVTGSTFELRNAANTLIPGAVSYNSATRTASFTPAAALSNSTGYTATLRGGATDPRIKDLADNALATNFTWNFTTVAASPLTVSANTPANGATGISTSTVVTATFNQAIDPATLTATTFELRNAANTLIPATLNYNATTRVATLTPSAALANSSVYTATLRGGTTDPRIKTASGISMATDYTWNFTTAAASTQTGPFTIWSATTTPATIADPDKKAVELGVKFRVSVNGFITGIRYYKSSTNTGTHVGTLWSRTGTVLGRATFTSETSSGWQQVMFNTPIPINAGTTYVASYHTNTGRYSKNSNYFTTNVGLSPILQALANGVDGPNGVYRYGANSIFPTSSTRSSNYWVDVVFSPNTAPDTSPPTVTATSPVNLATGVNVTSAVTATFSEDISSATVTGSTFELRNAANTLIPGAVSYNSATRTASFTPAAALSNSTGYTATLRGGATDPRIKDLADNALATNFTWNFTTVAASPLAVSANTPANGATGISTSTLVTATFNQAIDPATLTATTFELRNAANTLIPATLNYNATTRVATLTPSAALANSSVYTATLRGGTTDPRIKTASGISMAADYTWNFTTVAAAPLTVTANTPANGATGISINTSVTATFNQAVDPATLTATTFELRNAANSLIPATLNYNATTRVATLTPSAALANSSVYTATLRGGTTDPRIKTVTGISMAADYTWNFTTVAAIPLTVTASTPANGSTGIPTSTSITATFNQAVDPGSITSTTFELRNSANTVIAGNLNYNSTSRTATLTPSVTLANSTVYTATLKGGNTDPRIRDLSGNYLVSNYVWSFTTAAASSQTGPFSIWNSTTTPAVISEPDPSAVELGVKFRASVNGFITGIRFYKGPNNTGIHTANLWSRTGTNLARATFTSETASGWQQVLFSSPVAITAGTTYIGSYHTPTGNYSVNENYFATAGTVSGNLQALANGIDGSNGVYSYASASSFPSSSYNSSNYWVDVLFTTNSTANPLQSTLAASTLLNTAPGKVDLKNVSDANLPTDEKISLICYPNPFSGNARVEFVVPTHESNVILDIYSSMGTKTKRVYEGTANANEAYSFQIDTANLAAGIYFIYLKTSRGVESRKVIMN